jgi:hypothetical protein
MGRDTIGFVVLTLMIFGGNGFGVPQQLAPYRLLVEPQGASHGRYFPNLRINGNYGGLGRSMGGVHGPDVTPGQIVELRGGSEQDIRQALLNLEPRSEQGTVAQQGRELAQRERQLAQDRFRPGVINNVEAIIA